MSGAQPRLSDGAQRLEVGRPWARPPPAASGSRLRPGRSVGTSSTEGVEHGGQDVDVPHGRADHPRAKRARRVDDQGHAQGGLVGEDAVGVLAVLAQRLAVVGGERRRGCAPSAPAARSGSSSGPRAASAAATSPVVGRRRSGRRTARAARRGSAARRGGRRRRTALPAHVLEPGAPRGRDRLRPRPLRHRKAAVVSVPAEPVVVDVEAAVQAEARVEGEGAHERARPLAAALQQRGERRLESRGSGSRCCRARRAPAGSGRRAGSRGTGGSPRCGRAPRSKRTPASARRSIHGVSRLPAVAAERVGAQGVDRDQQDREAGVTAQVRPAHADERDRRDRRGGHGDRGDDPPPPQARVPVPVCHTETKERTSMILDTRALAVSRVSGPRGAGARPGLEGHGAARGAATDPAGARSPVPP